MNYYRFYRNIGLGLIIPFIFLNIAFIQLILEDLKPNITVIWGSGFFLEFYIFIGFSILIFNLAAHYEKKLEKVKTP